MRHVYTNEIRNLLPGIRESMMLGKQRYRDQEYSVEVEAEHVRQSMIERVGVVALRGFGIRIRGQRIRGEDLEL